MHDLPSDAFDWVLCSPRKGHAHVLTRQLNAHAAMALSARITSTRHLRLAWAHCEPDTTPRAFDAARTSRPCSSHCSTPSLQQSGIIRHAPNGRVSPSMDNRAMAELSAAGSQTLTQVWFLHRLSRASILRKLTPHGDQDSKTRCYKGAARRTLSESGDVTYSLTSRQLYLEQSGTHYPVIGSNRITICRRTHARRAACAKQRSQPPGMPIPGGHASRTMSRAV